MRIERSSDISDHINIIHTVDFEKSDFRIILLFNFKELLMDLNIFISLSINAILLTWVES